MQKPKDVTSKQIREALLVLSVAGFEGRGKNADNIPDKVADLARQFSASMYHAHLSDCHEVNALDNADLHIAMMQEPVFFLQH